MMIRIPIRHLALLTGFFMAFSGLNGQSLTSARSDVYSQYMIKNGKPEKITVSTAYYHDTEVTKEKKVMEYSVNLDTIRETRHKDGEVKARIMFVFNDRHQLIFRRSENRIGTLGWQAEKTVYSYDENGLCGMWTKSLNDQLKSYVRVKCDSLGNPEKFELYGPDLLLAGTETGTYIYAKNKWTHRVYNADGGLVLEEELNIKGVMPEGSRYNEQGDCIFYPRNDYKGDNVYYESIFKYDDYGNWVEEKSYEVQMIDGRVVSRRKDQVLRRKIIYRKPG